MSREFRINGETLVRVQGGSHLSGLWSSGVDLGLASEGIRITPRFYHYDVKAADFGPDAPVEVLWNLAEVQVHMNLVHYDHDVLDTCLQESMGGGSPVFFAGDIITGAGQPLGNNIPVLSSGCHYMRVTLTSPVLLFPWRFKASYLTGPPVEIPVGAERTIASCVWRAIPYAPLNASGEVASSGVTIWDHGGPDV